MLYFHADARDGVMAGAVCSACCCHTLNMRPGETNLVAINYAPWTLPIGSPGIVPQLEFDLVADESSCPTSAIEGFLPPENTNYPALVTPAGILLAIDLSTNEAPAGNTFIYSIVPMYGPRYGTLVQTGLAGAPTFDYTPNGGFTGYDYFSYKMEDAQGRSIIRHVRISVGSHLAKANAGRMSLVPFIDTAAIQTSTVMQEVRFPLLMPISVRSCERFKLTIRQPAKDCAGNLYQHLICFDIIPKDC